MRKVLGKIKNPTKAKEYRRRLSIRKKVEGTAERPRVCVTKTNKHLRVQAVDDLTNKTLFSVQSYGKTKVADAGNAEGAKKIGAAVAAQLKKANVSVAVFDRSGKQYTGVIKVLADSIRENGIQL
jgi:large subunit ribosomal protein L18